MLRKPPDSKKPALAQTRTGSLNFGLLPSKRENSIIAEDLADLQVARLLARFPISVPTARVVAELAYGRTAQ